MKAKVYPQMKEMHACHEDHPTRILQGALNISGVFAIYSMQWRHATSGGRAQKSRRIAVRNKAALKRRGGRTGEGGRGGLRGWCGES